MGAMPESVPVRCPACRRERLYTVPRYPCACGAPVAARLDPRAAPKAVAHRTWEEEWITVRCRSCGRHGQWPRPARQREPQDGAAGEAYFRPGPLDVVAEGPAATRNQLLLQRTRNEGSQG
ncbi:hypothetical protein P1P75_22760, partial [Streptomyces sp. ID05-39B]|nr:hypothetical protein [Streptomyces sp. ID05-39B]